MKRVIVVGSSGQDGEILFERLRAQGHYVVGLDRGEFRCTETAGGLDLPAAATCGRPIDILDPAAVESLVAAVAADEVYYLAAFHRSAEECAANDRVDFERSFAIQVSGLLNFLAAIEQKSPRTRLFNAGSARIFGIPERIPQDEGTPINPDCVYGISKAAGMRCVRYFRRTHGLFAVSGILYNHESPRRPPRLVTQKIIRAVAAIKAGEQSKLLLGDLDAVVDWGYAPDYVDAMIRILDLAEPDDFIVATGEPHTVRDFVEITFREVGLDWRQHVEVVVPSIVSRQPRKLIGNPERLKAATGWQPSVPFAEMIQLYSQPRIAGVNSHKTLIFVPTYNERDNAPELFRQVFALGLDADILFLDDNSPDGTGELLDQLAAKHECLHVIHRTGKLGIGSAHVDGINWAYDHGYAQLTTMDCDFTHSPADIPRLLECSNEFDVVVASRWLKAGSLPGWNPLRRFLTNFGHFLTRVMLGMPHDATGAFRVYNLAIIPREVFQAVGSKSYAFFFESLFLLSCNGYSIHEVPIVLPSRMYGHSKMDWREAVRSAIRVWKLFVAKTLHPSQFLITSDSPKPSASDPR